jgi:hypothetical protein
MNENTKKISFKILIEEFTLIFGNFVIFFLRRIKKIANKISVNIRIGLDVSII